MKKIGLFTDVHGNIWALDAILQLFSEQQCDQLIFCGDAVSMGSRSQQCLERLFSLPNTVLLMGNHDRDFVINKTMHAPFSHTSQRHKQFVFDSIDSRFRALVAQLPLQYNFTHGNTRFLFCHYATVQNADYTKEYPFMPLVSNPDCESLKQTFQHNNFDVVFFGHKHEPCDIVDHQHNKVYVDIGSVGCHPQPVARGIILQLNDDGSYSYQRVSAPYDRQKLKDDMLQGDLPDAQYIFDFYFDRKYGTNGDTTK